MSGITDVGFITGLQYIAAGIAIIPAFGAAIGQGRAAADAVTAVGRQPEARGDIMITMIVGQAITETSGIYGLIVALLLIFA